MAKGETSTYVKALSSVLMVMHSRGLPPPICLTYAGQQIVEVQVREAHYRHWLEALIDPSMESEQHEGRTHLHATGPLRHNRKVTARLTTVSGVALAEVGA